MLKRYMLLAVATVFLAFQLLTGSANAIEIDEAVRTVPGDASGATVTASLDDLANGERKFNFACSICHTGGDTKTNPTINLSTGSLEGATPSRNNVAALVDYMNNPTTYDGLEEIAELHPSTQSTDVFPQMRNLNDDDLVDVAEYILVQPNIKGESWGGGKSTR